MSNIKEILITADGGVKKIIIKEGEGNTYPLENQMASGIYI